MSFLWSYRKCHVWSSMTEVMVHFQVSVSEKLYLAMNVVRKVTCRGKLSNNSHLAAKLKIHFSAQNYVIMKSFHNGNRLYVSNWHLSMRVVLQRTSRRSESNFFLLFRGISSNLDHLALPDSTYKGINQGKTRLQSK